MVATQEVGSAFGELGLVNTGKPYRTATIKSCDKKVELATLSRQMFNKFLLKINEAQLSKKVAFLMNYSAFSKLTRRKIISYTEFLEKIKYIRGAFVY